MENEIMYEIETHPWEPWMPVNAKVLFMGTFPPGAHRWSMEFYYPNPINDFWRIIGLIFSDNKNMLYDETQKCFDLDKIKKLTSTYGIAMSDTVKKARRLKGNASDKYLDVIEGNDPAGLIDKLPLCTDIATTGEKATAVMAELTGTKAPKMGEYTLWHFRNDRSIRIWRMPSTSRAYPMAIEKKAEYYKNLLMACGILKTV